MRGVRFGLRGRLLIVIGVVLLPIGLLIAHATFEERRVAVRDVEQQAIGLARSLGEERRGRLFNRTRQFLRVIAALPEATGGDPVRCSALFGELVRLDRRYVEIGAATVEGDVFCGARSLKEGKNIADRPYFRAAVAMHGFAVGEYEKGTDGVKHVLVLAHAALDRYHRVRGVVFAELDLGSLDLASHGAALPSGAFEALLDPRGRVLARYPTTYLPLGATIRDDALLDALGALDEGTIASEADGVPRLLGFAGISDRDTRTYAHVVVGIPRSVAYAESNRRFVRNLTILGLSGLIALGLAWIGGDLLVLRGIRGLLAASRRMMAGDVDPEMRLRGATGELGELGKTVADMAEAVRSKARAAEEADSARRLSEHALASEHAFVAAVLDVVGALVVVLDSDGRVVRFNRACEVTTGYTLAEVRGVPFWNVFVHPTRVEAATALFETLRASRSPTYEEGVLLTKEGQPRRIAWTSTAVRDSDGTTQFVVATGIDVTERKRAEDALRRSEATARAFLESAAEAVLIVDAAGRIMVMNAQAERIFGYTRDELLGQSIELLVPERFRELHVLHRARYVADPKIVPVDSRLTLAGQRRDGGEFPAEISLSYIQTRDGLRVMAFIVDITERVAMQQRAKQTEKLAALGTLAAGIAHEVNNPVGIITARAELMLGDPDLTTEQADDLDVVLRQARRVGKIVTGLLAFARRSPGTREPVDLNAIIDETMDLVEQPMRKERVALDLELDRSIPSILGDPTAIQQVILNLFTNAREAMTGGGELRIATGLVADGGRVRITVRDTGPGMPPEILAKIFEPFFSTKPQGTGLGLAVSYGIVQEHRGTIDVESKPGVGTTFVLTFPIADSPEPTAGAPGVRATAAPPPGIGSVSSR